MLRLKIKYRETLIRAFQAVVRGQQRPEPRLLSEMARDEIQPADRQAFIQMLSDALAHLHEGSIARYKLRRSEYLLWQAACSAPG